jgi:hypothetical protein
LATNLFIVGAIILDLFSSKPNQRKKLSSNASLTTFLPNMPPKGHKSSPAATRTSSRETTATHKVLENREMAASKDKLNKLVEAALADLSSASENEAIVSTTPEQHRASSASEDEAIVSTAPKQPPAHKPLTSSSEDEAIASTPPKQRRTRKPLTPPPPVLELMTFFLVAKVFIASKCVYRVTKDAIPVYSFDVDSFFDDIYNTISSTAPEHEGLRHIGFKSSIAKISFKGAKQGEIEEVAVVDAPAFGEHVDPLLVFFFKNGRKGLKVDWRIQYDARKKKDARASSELESDSDTKPSKKAKKKRKVAVHFEFGS